MNRAAFLVGIAFGFLVPANRLHDYDVIHNALLFRELDLYLMFGSAVATGAALLLLLQRLGWRTRYGGRLQVARENVQRHHVLGAAVFGAGWAVAGTCPIPVLAMTASGSILGAIVIAGLFTGILLRDRLVARAGAEQSAAGAAASLVTASPRP